ncbi:hypothetical protein A2215_00020 [Candidatus Berkelbacteria bacterium RIFOXYA2_FULL_43_10]|uniref:YdbS-like PH domain-containing protein n=1 Tax=Candidatus Berkelbacteria bacterium RIFOXYA2_FULL_43_10 TaxID=1797472 RepID=A0A1F5E8K3_9BACT|nr:MAG: hypothetical protein A2215_00020 [Candidatus Berkelbacteria bacterium RIFOXYA2_FULL_43_10]
MTIRGKLFPSQGAEEKVFLVLRRHWFTYLAFLIIAFIMALPLFIALSYMLTTPEVFSGAFGNAVILIGGAYSLFIAGLMLYGFVDYYLDVYIVTDERIVDIIQSGFFKRSISELHLHQVQDVSARVDGFFATMMHYGQIEIQTAGERPNFVFRAVPNPYRVSKIIVDLHEAQIENYAREGIAEESRDTRLKHHMGGFGEGDFEMMSGLSGRTLSSARKRTKEILQDKSVTDEELRNETEDEIESASHRAMLKHIESEKMSEGSSSRSTIEKNGSVEGSNADDDLNKIDDNKSELSGESETLSLDENEEKIL